MSLAYLKRLWNGVPQATLAALIANGLTALIVWTFTVLARLQWIPRGQSVPLTFLLIGCIVAIELFITWAWAKWLPYAELPPWIARIPALKKPAKVGMLVFLLVAYLAATGGLSAVDNYIMGHPLLDGLTPTSLQSWLQRAVDVAFGAPAEPVDQEGNYWVTRDGRIWPPP